LLSGSILLAVPYWKYCLSLGRRHACGTRGVRYAIQILIFCMRAPSDCARDL
jgi:hypothetical protein